MIALLRFSPYLISAACAVALVLLWQERTDLTATINVQQSEIERLDDELFTAQEKIDAAAVADETRAEEARLSSLSDAESSLNGADDGEISEVLSRALDILRQ